MLLGWMIYCAGVEAFYNPPLNPLKGTLVSIELNRSRSD